MRQRRANRKIADAWGVPDQIDRILRKHRDDEPASSAVTLTEPDDGPPLLDPLRLWPDDGWRAALRLPQNESCRPPKSARRDLGLEPPSRYSAT